MAFTRIHNPISIEFDLRSKRVEIDGRAVSGRWNQLVHLYAALILRWKRNPRDPAFLTAEQLRQIGPWRNKAQAATVGVSATVTGPQGFGADQYLPTGDALPYEISFANPPTASAMPGSVEVISRLDAQLDPRTFRLGDIKIGDIQVHIPDGRATFQGDFDFTRSKGFILRVTEIDDVGLAFSNTTAIASVLRKHGCPNYYGDQRFGREGDNASRGLASCRRTIRRGLVNARKNVLKKFCDRTPTSPTWQ